MQEKACHWNWQSYTHSFLKFNLKIFMIPGIWTEHQLQQPKIIREDWSECWLCWENSDMRNYHRITEWFKVERTSKIILVPIPLPQTGCHPLDQVAESPIQTSLEHFSGWCLQNSFGKPNSVPHHPHSEEFLLYIFSSLYLRIIPILIVSENTSKD